MSSPPEPGLPHCSIVILAFGDEPVLADAVDSVLASEGVLVDVVLVDNGCTTDAVDRLQTRDNLRILRPCTNLGFAGGCNFGARHASGEFVGFVNGDAIVEPDALRRLVEVAADPSVALASASLRLLDRPDRMNSAGNPIHFSGLSWAGGLGDPVPWHSKSGDVASVTGAAVVAERTVFDDLGGFCELMFAYCEDAELSLRAWLRGLRCRYVADSVVLHRYEFSRNPKKLYLLERNRLLMIATLYEARTLALLLPALLGLEAAMIAVSFRQGWVGQKLSGYWWLLRHSRQVLRRRSHVQQARMFGDYALASVLTGDFTPGGQTGLSVPTPVRAVSKAYWRLVRRRLYAHEHPRPGRHL